MVAPYRAVAAAAAAAAASAGPRASVSHPALHWQPSPAPSSIVAGIHLINATLAEIEVRGVGEQWQGLALAVCAVAVTGESSDSARHGCFRVSSFAVKTDSCDCPRTSGRITEQHWHHLARHCQHHTQPERCCALSITRRHRVPLATLASVSSHWQQHAGAGSLSWRPHGSSGSGPTRAGGSSGWCHRDSHATHEH